MLFDFKKWCPSFAEKHMKTFFQKVITKKSLWEQICRQNRTKTFGASLGKFGRKSFAAPQNLPAPTPMT